MKRSTNMGKLSLWCVYIMCILGKKRKKEGKVYEHFGNVWTAYSAYKYASPVTISLLFLNYPSYVYGSERKSTLNYGHS